MQHFFLSPFSIIRQFHLLRGLLTLFVIASTLSVQAQPWNWAIDAGGTGNVDFNKSIATDADSNVYCAGTFGGNNVVFGTQTNPSTNNHIWGFVSKYDRFGNFIWVRIISHSINDVSVDRIAISEQNEICITGTTKQGTVSFGNGVTLISSNPSTNMYLARFDVSGNAQWARALTTSGSSLCATGGLDFDATGNSYFSGTFTSSSSSPVTINGTTYTQNGASIFVRKYDPAGNSVWFRNTLTPGTGSRKAYGLSIVNDQLYICGMVGVPTTFDTIAIGNLFGQSCYIARYDLAGNTGWVTEYAGPSDTHLLDVSADDHNSVFAVGRHQGTVYVDGDTLVSDGSAEDAVILCLDTLGNKKWCALVGSTQADWARAVDADGFGNAYVSGHLRGTIDFMGTTVTTSTNQTDLFVAKVSGAGPLKWIKSGGGPLNDYALAVHHEKGSNRIYTGGYYSWTATYGSSTLNDVGNGDMMLIQLSDTTFDVSATVTASCLNSCNGSITVFTNGTPVLYQWSNISGNVSHQENLCPGIYGLTVTHADGRTRTVQIEVPQTTPANIVFNPVSSVCINSAAIILTGASPAGGTYTVNGIATNVFDPSALGVGVHEVGYAYANAAGCPDTVLHEITVNALTPLTFPAIAAVCVNQASFPVTSATPSGGVYSGNGINGNLFGPLVAGAGDHTITYAYTDTTGCVNTTSQTITVHALPLLSYQEVDGACIDLPAFNLANATPAGGTYSGNGVIGQLFDPLTAGAGNHSISYTYTDANGCTSSIPETITVHPLPVLSYTGANEVCLNDAAFLLTATPGGGTYSGDGVTGQSFNPLTAGAGDHTINYTYTDANSCTSSISETITVHSLPVLAFTGVNEACLNDAAFLLTATPGGGTYSGDGVMGQLFNPALAGSGIHEIQYSYADANGCSNELSYPITVHGLPAVSVSVPTDSLCRDAPAFSLSGGSPAGGSFAVNGTNGDLFDPQQTGTGEQTVSYTFTDQNGCSNTAHQTISVLGLPEVSYDETHDYVCSYDEPFTLDQGIPAGGTYNGAGVSNAIFDPAGLNTGWHVITYSYTDPSGCSAQVQDSVLVDECLGFDLLSEGLVQINPNPAQDVVTISTGNTIAAQITMLDSKGSLVLQFKPENVKTVVDLSKLAFGIYTVQVELQGKMQVLKVVKSL